MSYNSIPTLKEVPRYPTRSDGERLDELMQAALNGGSDMVEALNKDFIPAVNAVIPALNEAMPNLSAIIAAPEKAAQAAASATAAASSATSASGSATTSTNAKTAAEAAKTAAHGSATAAAGSATTASTKAGEAAASATSASGSAATATTAKNTAELAKTAAESAKTAAQGSATASAGSATSANTAKTQAEAAKTATQTAEANALDSKNAAAGSATNAATSETNATASKNAAAGSASAANTAKLAAEAANTAAQTAKTGAETARTQADAAKTAAADSATAAKASETESAVILKKVEDAEIGVFPPATETTAGVVKLSSAIDSESVTEAATPSAVNQAADLAKAARTSSESWTLTAAVAAGAQITLPRGYIVGAKEMLLFKGGMLIGYTDMGTPGKWSTVCKLTGAAASGDVLTMVGPLEYAPSVVLDFEGGAWPKELVCTRATVDYVFDDEGKVQEVPVNTPAITKDPVTGRKGLQVYPQRTRLNKYYKSNGEGRFYCNTQRGTKLSNISDINSPTNEAVRTTFTKSEHIHTDNMSYVRYDIHLDIGAEPLSVDKNYAISVCVKASVPFDAAFGVHSSNGSIIYRQTCTLGVAYSILTITGKISAGSNFSYVELSWSKDNLPDSAAIDIAYIQIEESAIPTPLIAGPEGQQVTVGLYGCYLNLQEQLSTVSVVTSKKYAKNRTDGVEQNYLCEISTPFNYERCQIAVNFNAVNNQPQAVAYVKDSSTKWVNIGHFPYGPIKPDVATVGMVIKDANNLKMSLNGGVNTKYSALPAGFTVGKFSSLRIMDGTNTNNFYYIQYYPYLLSDQAMSALTAIPE